MKRIPIVWTGILALLVSSEAVNADLISPTVEGFSSQLVGGFNRQAAHTVDGSGLSGTGDSSSTHGNGANGVAWTTTGTNLLGGGNDFDPFITFDLGDRYNVDTIRIWNFNESILPAVGPSSIELFSSTDNLLFVSQGTIAPAIASGIVSGPAQDFAVAFDARFVRFDILANHDGAIFDGTGTLRGNDGRSLTGLSEVRFEGSVIPEPSSFLLCVFGLVALTIARRR
jgi:hypothetical protein